MIPESELEKHFPANQDNPSTPGIRIGTIVGGSLSKGLVVKLDAGELPGSMIEQLAVGRYVVVQGLTERRFFCIVTDVALEHTNPSVESNPPEATDIIMAEVYRSTLAYGKANVAPMLVLEHGSEEPKPVKTIPAHFSVVVQANEEDVAKVFGKADSDHFYIGNPIEMDQVPINVNLDRFIERSSGVFGKSGTGKSFITRTLLSGIVKSDKASCLIFDMHNDYGWAIKNEHGREYKGLQQLFDAHQVNVITLDPETSQARGNRHDGALHIPYDAIEPEDIAMLAGVLTLSEVQVNALYFLRRRLGRKWLRKLLSNDENDQSELDEFVQQGDLIKGTLGAIQRKFEIFRRMGFLKTNVSEDIVETLFQKLNSGISIVLEFGIYGDSLPAYMFVANYLTRRIHHRYVATKNKAFGQQGDEPNPLMIVIEEAHKFL
ncbi:MAG TPA: ATPase, partial [Chloroflexi bacterium]|nr:ATPase [Chloroflexota bacterium]